MSFRGLTPQERAIMDRWDAGQSIRQIARALGKDAGRVRNLVGQFDGASDHRLAKSTMATGSARLLRAIQQELGQQERAA